jgi:hypothetical protein
MRKIIFTAGIMSIILSCGPSRFVEPLDKKQISIGGNFGGPIIDFGGPIPIPISSIEIGYGIDTNLTVFGTAHTTSLLFGNLQMDFGATFKLLDQNKYVPNISVSPGFNFIYSFSGATGKFWPTIDANVYWNYGKKQSYFYLGINNYFELSSTMANNQPQASYWLFNPQIGHILKGKNGNGQFTAELKWLGPNQRNDYAFIPYYTPQGSNGALGLYFGYRWILKNKTK